MSGREKFQGETLDWIWLDEEPPADIYTEALTRTNVGNGPVWLTFTPLQGVSEVVRRFLHEKEARVKGIPVLGSGRVSEERIAIEHRDIPAHWPRIGGLDFGWDHQTYRVREATPIIHSGALRSWGKDLRWAWPRDGRRETLEGAGVALAEQYKEQGLEMLWEHAQFEEGSVSVEAGLMKMLTMMQAGRFKVFKHLNDWFEEFRLYHRKDGKVVKEGDDLMSATRYAVMMLRHARTTRQFDSFRRELQYPKQVFI
jgi:phage terminase large subunit-like protein